LTASLSPVVGVVASSNRLLWFISLDISFTTYSSALSDKGKSSIPNPPENLI